MSPWLIAYISAISTFVFIQLSRKVFPRLGLMDKPHEYGIKRSPIPYSVGIVFLPITLLLTTFFVQYKGGSMTPQLWSVIGAGALITIVSFIDDRIKLNHFIRLGVQGLAALIVVWGGLQIQQLSNPFGEPILLDTYSFNIWGHTIWILSAVLVAVWLVLCMNVMNWLDGVPGLASGVSAISFCTLLILSLGQFHIVDQTLVIVLSAGLAASTFIFWFFDFSPPKLLMGDTGSMFLGFMIGVISILAGGKMATALLVMGFPILDSIIVIVRRLLQGKSPFKGDYTHLHHRLMQSGLSERKTLLLLYVVCGLCGAVALFMPTTLSKVVAFGVIILGMTLLQRKIAKTP